MDSSQTETSPAPRSTYLNFLAGTAASLRGRVQKMYKVEYKYTHKHIKIKCFRRFI